MAIFKRADLKEQGLTDEQIEWVMTEGNRSLSANYTLNSDVQSRIDSAVSAIQPPDVTQSDEYKKLADELDMMKAIAGEEFSSVKPKFRKQVYELLDHGEKAPAISEQLKTIGEKYEEYFVSATPEDAAPAKPSFGAPTEGSAPTGKAGPSFMDSWGFVPKK
jgi:hypothetical protein